MGKHVIIHEILIRKRVAAASFCIIESIIKQQEKFLKMEDEEMRKSQSFLLRQKKFMGAIYLEKSITLFRMGRFGTANGWV